MNVDWPLVFQGVKTLLDPIAAASWPIAIGIVAWAFRGPITATIGRVRQVSGFGGTAEFATQELTQQSAEATPPASVPALNTNTLPPSDPIYDALDEQLAATLDQHVQGNADVKLAWAIRSRSVSEANRLHEFHYRLLFGSQINALKTLNVVGQGPLSEFETYFENLKSNPAYESFHKNRSFDQWAEFVANIGYAELVEGSDPPVVRITPFGRQFLQWMVVSSVPEVKPG
nr:hypothetical protein [Sphingomonas sp.]